MCSIKIMAPGELSAMLQENEGILQRVKDNWIDWVGVNPSFHGIIINKKSIISSLGIPCEYEPPSRIKNALIFHLFHKETGLFLHILVKVLLQLATVWSAGSMCSPRVSFGVIQSKHQQLVKLLEKQGVESLSDVKVNKSFFVVKESFDEKGVDNIRLYIDKDDHGNLAIVLD